MFGVQVYFLVVAGLLALLTVVLLLWRRPRAPYREREPFLPALVAGSRYVRHEPVVRLFAALGLGAVVGALGLGRVKQHLSSNAVLAGSALTFALGFGLLVVVPGLLAALPLLVVCGFAWTATVSTIVSELQLLLPGWVRARALSIDLMVFLGTQAIAAGHVVVWIEYEVADDQERDFLAAMEAMRGSRLRSGASRWDLFRVGERPDLFCEQFEVPTWGEHQLQHDGRLTGEDQALEDAAFGYVVGVPRTQHLLPARLPRAAGDPGPDPAGRLRQ